MVVIDLQEVKLPAYVTKPAKASNKTPGIILVHDWMGLGNFTKTVADRYAAQGYVTIAPDLYLGSLPNNPDEARKLSSAVTAPVSKKVLDGTVVYLKALDTTKVGITGFCFGGTQTFDHICDSKELSAGVIYYATRLPGQAQLQNIAAPLLIIYGDQDQHVSPEEAKQLESTLKVWVKMQSCSFILDALTLFSMKRTKKTTGRKLQRMRGKRRWNFSRDDYFLTGSLCIFFSKISIVCII